MDCIVIAKQTAYLKALGYCELSVPSYNMLFSLLTTAEFSLPSVENLTVDQDKAFPLIIIMFISNTLLLGNLLKEVKRNNMLITLELKKMSANFQNLPTLPL